MILAMLFIRTANIANEKRNSKDTNKKRRPSASFFFKILKAYLLKIIFLVMLIPLKVTV